MGKEDELALKESDPTGSPFGAVTVDPKGLQASRATWTFLVLA